MSNVNKDFSFDLFLSHSSKDKAVVRPLAERLRADGLKVWFDEWVLKPGDSIPAKIEEGLEHSRVLVLCMSAQAFGSDWAKLEAGTFRFRDPLNRERRFIPLRLDDAPIKGSLAQFLYINWYSADRELEYAKLVDSCLLHAQLLAPHTDFVATLSPKNIIHLKLKSRIQSFDFGSNGDLAITGHADGTVALWMIETGACVKNLEGHSAAHLGLLNQKQGVLSVELNGARRCAVTVGADMSVRFWELDSKKQPEQLSNSDLTREIISSWCFVSDVEGFQALSGSFDGRVILWNLHTGKRLAELKGHSTNVRCIAWNSQNSLAISGAADNSIRLWDIANRKCLRTFEGHTAAVRSLAWSPDQHHALSASEDGTLRLWNITKGLCLSVLKGHTSMVVAVAWSPDQQLALSGSIDGTLRLWQIESGTCLRTFTDLSGAFRKIVWAPDGRRAFSADTRGAIYVWDLSEFVTEAPAPKVTLPVSPLAPDQVQYTNAKVLLVGESGAGKTGLSKRLASDVWEPSDSTVGAWATQWKLAVAGGEGVEREIWLWDFGGQADQRLIHQLYMDETALAVLVFDGQKEDLFETLGQWDRDLTRASRKEFAKLLVAGRVDAGGLRLSRGEVEKFAAEHKFQGFLETSAKTGSRCEELKQAILAGINWNEIPCRTTELLFKRLKDEIIRLKDEGRVLMRINELRETLQLRLSGEANRKDGRFADEELRAVLTLLAGPGVVWELAFGSWVLLQPELINAYAQAVIRTLQADEHQRGCLMEERVLKGDLMYESSMERLQGDEERFVLLAMHQTLVERGLCFRQPTAQGNLLIFPSYYRRERPDLVKFPAILVNYRFTGFLDEIYATLVVRLHHFEAFVQDQLWRYAADFKTNTGKLLGVKLNRCAPGAGDLEVYFDSSISDGEKIIFSKYVYEHLQLHASDVERFRHYVCPNCGTPVGNRDVAMKRLNDWLQGRPLQSNTPKAGKGKNEPPSIICVGCEQRVPLWDDMEQSFASPRVQERVRDMREESNIVLDSESKERALVGEVISTVALAGQIGREFNVSDHGIDMEIEFKDDAYEATGSKLYLQLKSGDSYLRERKRDGAEIFTIKDERHARYWMAQAFPVLLVIRNAEGEVRCMEVRDWLKRASDNGKKQVKQIVFDGERFDVMTVRRWREKVLLGS